MSFQGIISKAIDDAVGIFIHTVYERFSVDESALLQMWNSSSTKSAPKVNVEKLHQNNHSQALLVAMKKDELVAMAKARNMSHTGTKEVLVARLTSGDVPIPKDSPKDSPKDISSGPSEKQVKAKPAPKEKVTKASPKISTKVSTKVSTKPTSLPKVTPIQKSQPIELKLNKFKNYEHTETGLVFDNINGKVTGKQHPNGSVSSLTDADIEVCKKFVFTFVMPSNLNKKEAIFDEDDGDDPAEDVKADGDDDGDDDVENFPEEEPEEDDDDDDAQGYDE